MTIPVSLVWFRRDLRAHDHAALHHALVSSDRVYCAFVFDSDILASLPPHDRRVRFIHDSLAELDQALRRLGGYLIVRHGPGADTIVALAQELAVDAVFTNHDQEPQAIARDCTVAARLQAAGRRLHTFKDQLVFERNEVLTQSGTPFSVFTPYKNAWLRRLLAEPEAIAPYPVAPRAAALAPPNAAPQLPSLDALGFGAAAHCSAPLAAGMDAAEQQLDAFCTRMADYAAARDYPARDGTSMLSVHLRFGTLSIREAVRAATAAGGAGADSWLSELVWREFYAMILYHHPRVASHAFKPAYDRIEWERGAQADADFDAWCEGRTGYPLVDAAMAQLNQTGFMHNRLRMVTASFLVKDLGIDWRSGEHYFARQLNDFELASNNGGWQWAASSGCDAQPYFRIFNPVTQSQKFDPEGQFIRRQLPQLAGLSRRDIHTPWLAPPMLLSEHYPAPLVQHEAARRRTLERYAVVKNS